MTTIPARRLHAILTRRDQSRRPFHGTGAGAERRGVLRRQDHQPGDRLRAPAAATTSMAACWRATWATTSPAIRRSWCRTCRAPAASGRRNTSIRSAPKDGTAIGTFGRQMGITPLLDAERAIRRHQVHLARQHHQRGLDLRHLAHRRGQDLERHARQADHVRRRRPGRRPGRVRELLYKNVFDAKIKLVSGYHGTTPIILAMERGEVDGLCGYSWSTIKSKNQSLARREEDQHPGAGRAEEGAGSCRTCRWRSISPRPTSSAQILKLFLTSQETARPFAAPPGIPADRKAALIAAFDADHEGPGIPGRGQEAQPRRQSAQRQDLPSN